MKFKFKKILACILSAAGATTLSVGLAGCLPKSADLTEPENVEITKLAPPEDGSLPTAHTCAENLAYVSYVFDGQTQYHSYSYGVTSASIATQTTRTFRDFKDGVLLTTDLTYSSMVKSGSQTCTLKNEEGEWDTYFRVSDTPAEDTVPTTAVWSEEAPKFYSTRAYHYSYGLLPTELFNYIVNEENIISSEELKVNGDGTYTQSFSLDPVASTFFYQFGMKTRGGLAGYPEFNTINMSVTFDGGWKILSCDVHEVAKINKGVVVDSISDFTCTYYYDGENFDQTHYDYYESYFKQYVGDDTLEKGGEGEEKLVVDVTSVLSNGFSGIMNGGEQFEISAKLGENTYYGYVWLSLDLADPLGTLALKASLGRSLKELSFYVEYLNGEMSVYYGDDFALSANLAEVKLAAGQFGEIIEKLKATFASGGATTYAAAYEDGGEQADPLTALMNSMQLKAGSTQAILILDTDDLLGMGIGINAQLSFGINGNTITFRGGSVGGLSIGGEPIDLKIVLNTTAEPVISRDKTEASADLAEYVADVYSLLGSDLLKVNLSLDGDGEKVSVNALKGVNADLTAYVDLDGLAVGAEASASYTYNGQQISATLQARYDYNATIGGYGKVVLWLKELNGAPVNLKLGCNIADLLDGINSILTFSGAEAGGALDGLSSILNGALSADLAPLLNNMHANKSHIEIGVSIDTVLEMLNIDAGVSFGSCALKYERGEGVHGGKLSANLPALGLSLGVCGEDGEVADIDSSDCLDLSYVISDINEIVSADLLKVGLALNGSAEGVAVKQLNGLTVTADAYLNLEGIAVKADLSVAYKLGNGNVSAKLSAWYEKGETSLGRLALSLTEINGVPVAANVCCDVDELKDAVVALLNYAGIQLAPFGDEGETVGAETADIITNLLGADFGALIPELNTSSTGLKLGLNVDSLLDVLGVNIGMNFGTVTLAYDHTSASKLLAQVPALGLTATVGGATGDITYPDTTGYFDLCDLVSTVEAAWKHVDEIMDAESIAFTLPEGGAYLSLDGITVGICGDGEVSWKANHEYVALDLHVSISENGTDETAIKLYYDKNAVDTPLVKLALNEVGLEIYRSDIDTVSEGFKTIYNRVKALLPATAAENGGAATTEPTTTEDTQPTTEPTQQPSEPAQQPTEPTAKDKLMSLIFGLITSQNWVDILNDFTFSSDGKSVALNYLAKNTASVVIDTQGDLTLNYSAKLGKRFTLAGELSVTPVTGSLVPVLEQEFAADGMKMSSTKQEGSAEFLRLAYDFLFDAIHSISVEHILGSDTYQVKFLLDGDNCNAKELEGVYVDAEIYVTGKQGEQGKLAEAVLNVNAAGVVVQLHVITEYRNGQTYFYMNLSQVADIKLPDLKFQATQSSLYETIKVLINTINDTNVLDVVGKLLPKSETTPAEGESAAESGEKITENQADKLASVLEKLLNFNFNSPVVATETNGVVEAEIDLDNILAQLGVETGSLGKVKAVINHNDHSMKTSGKATVKDADGNPVEKEWISLSSEKTDRRDYSSLKREDYISIEFLPDLISDLVSFATDNEGNIHDKFTLSGNITANIVNMFDIDIDVSALTVSLQNNDICLSALLHVKKMSALGLVTIPESSVGISLHGGYLTLARGVNTATPEYKIMTMDYFIDHMLVKSGSVLQWWLDIGGWNTVISIINSAAGDLNVSSGLTTPQDVYLYKAEVEKEEQEISMYDFVDALRVVIGGKKTADFGDITDLENTFKVYDNYYGFALNAGKITNGVLTKLYAALLRNENGISGVKASGAIQSYVTFSASLNYEENAATEYVMGNTLASGVTAPSMYDKANAVISAAGVKVEYDHFQKKSGYDEVFGCYSVADNTYDYSTMLYSHKLTINDYDGKTRTVDVRHGSNVFLYDDYSPLYTDESKGVRVLYSLTENTVGEPSFVMDKDITVYAVTCDSVIVVMHNGNSTIEYNAYVGAKVPTSVKGLETIGAVTYQDGTPVNEGDLITAAGTLHLYGTFVNREIVVNYVKYEFSSATNSYTAVGRGAGFNDYYCESGNTLILESSINGYPVTAIAANAFANTEGHALKKVIVPASIVTIGECAFLDNVGMQSAVFLAETVTLGGSSAEGEEGNTTPFYGCSATTGGETTNLNIYYNTVVFEGKTDNIKWTKFRRSGSGAIFHRYYVGVDPNGSPLIDYDHNGSGALHSAGTWSCVSTEITGADSVQEEGIDFAQEVASRVTVGIVENEYTQSQGDALAAELVTLLSGYRNEVGDAKYVVNVKVTNVCGNVTIRVTVSLNVPVSVRVSSQVAFSYTLGDNVQSLGAGEGSLNVIKVGDNVLLYAPEAQGYTFLGWAKDTDGSLTFVGETTAYDSNATYYAIWGHSKVGAEFSATANTSGTQLSAPVGSGVDGKWYDGSWNEITEISAQNTVVYTRSRLTLILSGNGDTNFKKDNVQVASGQKSYTDNSLEVYEGERIKVEGNATTTLKIIGSNGYTVTYTGKKSSGIPKSDRKFTLKDYVLDSEGYLTVTMAELVFTF